MRGLSGCDVWRGQRVEKLRVGRVRDVSCGSVCDYRARGQCGIVGIIVRRIVPEHV